MIDKILESIAEKLDKYIPLIIALLTLFIATQV
jgi:hypothetical protein